MPAPTRTPRSTWIDAGLRALAAGGPDAVRIDTLAKALGVTTGGSYWRFADRRALLEEVLDTWERRSTEEVIDRVEREGGDPRTTARRAARSPSPASCSRSISPSATGPAATARSRSACAA
jgi:AcrR family transcriptional regulator